MSSLTIEPYVAPAGWDNSSGSPTGAPKATEQGATWGHWMGDGLYGTGDPPQPISPLRESKRSISPTRSRVWSSTRSNDGPSDGGSVSRISLFSTPSFIADQRRRRADLLEDEEKYKQMAQLHDAYGDGTTSKQIADILLRTEQAETMAG